MRPAAAVDSLQAALAAAEAGERLNQKQALALLEEADLLTLGRLAQASRFRHNPDPLVTYAVDRNINFTNVCTSGCRFCAFFRPPGSKEGYVLDKKELGKKIQETLDLGGSHILIQGGLHPEVGIEAICEMFAFIKENYAIGIHGLSPPEVVHMAALDSISLDQALDRLIAAGLDSIPGGGAEILVDRVREKIAPGKCSAAEWLQVMALAHAKDLMTTATMMFGHIETSAERIEHLARLRDLQDQSLARGKGHFTAFIPWSFQPDNTALPDIEKATANDYLRMLAVSRLFLDNFDHLQASWVTQGAKIAQVSLTFGADDLGSTMIEENVVAAAGVHFKLPAEELVRLAREMGFAARQRNTFYQPVGAMHT